MDSATVTGGSRVRTRCLRARVKTAAVAWLLVAGWLVGGMLAPSSAQAQTTAETNAVNWAVGQIGSTAWPGLCLPFVQAAYEDGASINLEDLTSGVTYNADTDPEDVWGHTTAGTTGTGTPPYGALVFFNAKPGYDPEDYSHVAIMGANGKVISTPDAVDESAVHYETLAQHADSGAYDTYVGWWLPDGSSSPAGPPADGSFVSYAGNVYVIAGGAPLYVSNWAAVGGAQPTEALTAAQWSALNPVPSNGTLISSTATGMVYEIAGGAPLYVSNWAAIGGARSAVGIDQWDLDNISNPMAHMNAVPSDGTLIGASAGGPFGGGVFIIAGGAPLYVSNWPAIGGPQSVVGVDEWDIQNITNPAAHMNAVPANGTLINSTATGMVYEIAGGAPLYVSNWAAIGGARSAVGIDQWDLDNISNPLAHLNPVPANGTLLGSSSGGVFVVAGGAPLYVSNWAAIGGPQPVVSIDQWDIANSTNPAAHLNPVPANGTFINTSTGNVYRIAGGAPFAVSSWSVFGGEQPYVTVDEWDIDNITNPAAHLDATPISGTIVEGLPSDSYWSFSGGYRSSMGANPAAVGVDDVGLASFPLQPSSAGGTGGTAATGAGGGGESKPSGASLCEVPSVKGLTLSKATKALARAQCQLGKVHGPRRGAPSHVIRQSAKPGSTHPAGYAVTLTLAVRHR